MYNFLNVHMLKNLPLSRPNADDSGKQKETIFGGMPRSRISSQCLKRNVRDYWSNHFDAEILYRYLGKRTKYVKNLIVEKAKSFAKDEKQQEDIAKVVIQKFFDKGYPVKDKKTGEELVSYLVQTSDSELDNILEHVKTCLENGIELKKINWKEFKDIGRTVDVAMFGRMQASAKDHEVYASVQVAHAIAVNALSDEFDYFSSVDDFKEDNDISGAGHLGSLSCNSSCYYMYYNICVDKLMENIGGDQEFAAEAVGEIIKAFAFADLSGKQNSFAHNTLPELIMVEAHNGQSVNLVNAFERPVSPYANKSLTDISVERLLEHKKGLVDMYGELMPSGPVFISSTKDVADKISFDKLCKEVVDLLKK